MDIFSSVEHQVFNQVSISYWIAPLVDGADDCAGRGLHLDVLQAAREAGRLAVEGAVQVYHLLKSYWTMLSTRPHVYMMSCVRCRTYTVGTGHKGKWILDRPRYQANYRAQRLHWQQLQSLSKHLLQWHCKHLTQHWKLFLNPLMSWYSDAISNQSKQGAL